MQTTNPMAPGSELGAGPQSATPNPAAMQGAGPNTQSGFAPIPTRMSDLAPLVVQPDSDNADAVRDQLQELDQQLASIHSTSAEAWVSQGNYQEGLKHAEMAYTLAPSDISFANQCGYLRYMCEDDAGAVEAFSKVLEIAPEQIDAVINLGTVEFGRENWEVSKNWFLRAVRQLPEDAEVWNNLGACIFQAGNPTEAAAYFRKALEIDPTNEDAKANLACC